MNPKGCFPPSSKKCFNKDRQKNWDRHRQRLVNMSAHVDTRRPQSYDAPSYNMKKLQLMEDRQIEIERENQMLLNKITNIMQTDKIKKVQPTVRFQRSGVNEVKRKHELLKITMENQYILKRIKEKKSVYNTRKLQQDYQKHKKYRQNLCEYPYIIEDKNSVYDSERLNTQENDQNEEEFTQPPKKKIINKQRQINQILKPVNDEPTPEGFRVLAKKSKKIGMNLFIIEITVKEGIFKITADDVENPLTRVLEMQEKDGDKVINEFFEGSIDKLIDNLKITDKIYIKGLEEFQQQPDAQIYNSSPAPKKKGLQSPQIRISPKKPIKQPTPQKPNKANNNNINKSNNNQQQQPSQKKEDTKNNNSKPLKNTESKKSTRKEEEPKKEVVKEEKQEKKSTQQDEENYEDEYEEEFEDKEKNQKSQQNKSNNEDEDYEYKDDEYEEDIEKSQQENNNKQKKQDEDAVDDDYENDYEEEINDNKKDDEDEYKEEIDDEDQYEEEFDQQSDNNNKKKVEEEQVEDDEYLDEDYEEEI